MTIIGPFACIRTDRLVEGVINGDEATRERNKAILRRVTLPHGECQRLRDFEICKLAALIKQAVPNIVDSIVNRVIAAAIHKRRADPDLGRFSDDERREIATRAAEIVSWMDGKKKTLDAREIGRIIKLGT